jgi:hypothetical protein
MKEFKNTTGEPVRAARIITAGGLTIHYEDGKQPGYTGVPKTFYDLGVPQQGDWLVVPGRGNPFWVAGSAFDAEYKPD